MMTSSESSSSAGGRDANTTIAEAGEARWLRFDGDFGGAMEPSTTTTVAVNSTVAMRLPRSALAPRPRPTPTASRLLLSMPDDRHYLSGPFCVLRRHVEAFVVVVPDDDDDDGKNAGRVGVRCVHCADEEENRRKQKGSSRRRRPATRGAAFYPKSIRLVYQAVRNMQRFHFSACDSVPREAKEEFFEASGKGKGKSRSSRDAPSYWEECCLNMGMIDSGDERGIRLRGSGFVVAGGGEGAPLSSSIGAESGNGTAANAKVATISALPTRSTIVGEGGSYNESSGVGGSRATEACQRIVADVAVSGDDGYGRPAVAAIESSRDRAMSRSLDLTTDRIFLSDLFCFTRRHVEAFVGPPLLAMGGGHQATGAKDGRVGLRCPYCAGTRRGEKGVGTGRSWRAGDLPRTKGAVLYPKSIRLVYQAVRNFQRYHVLSCPDVPDDVKTRYVALKKGKIGRSGRHAPKYWEECCRRMGMVDVGPPPGSNGEVKGGYIRLRGDYFEDAGSKGPFLFGESDGGGGSGAQQKDAAAVSAVRSDGMGVGAELRPAEPGLPSGQKSDVVDRTNRRHGTGDNVKARALTAREIANPAAAAAANAAAASEQIGPSCCESTAQDIAKEDQDGSNGHPSTASSASPGRSAGAECVRAAPAAATEGDIDANATIFPLDDAAMKAALAHPAPLPLEPIDPGIFDTFGLSDIVGEAAPSSDHAPDQHLAHSGEATVAAAEVDDLCASAHLEALDDPTASCTTLSLDDDRPIEANIFEDDDAADDDDAVSGLSLFGALSRSSGSRGRWWDEFASAKVVGAKTARSSPSDRHRYDRPRADSGEENSAPASVAAAAAAAADGDLRGATTTASGGTPDLEKVLCAAATSSFDDDRPIDGNIFEDDDTCRSTASPTGGGRVPDDEVLTMVRLALSLVGAVRQIQRLPTPPLSARDEEEEEKEQPGGDSDLTFLGTELYDLFSGGRSLRDDDGDYAWADGEDDVGAAARRRGKREKRRGGTGRGERVSLTDLGLPPVIDALVSSLLDRGGTGGCGGERRRRAYESVWDAEDDLRLMASQPQRYLFRAASWRLRLAPNTLYGCGEETARLLEAYRRTTDPTAGALQTKEVVLISGYSGTGKSALVQNARYRFEDAGARFLSGKFDAMRQLQPLSAVVSALDRYCVLLAENSNRICEVRESIESVIGGEGRAILSSFIPNFKRLVSPATDERPPGVTSARGGEVLQQLVFLIRMLFRATCNRARPVVLFLDDLQWSDEVSLTLMEALVTDTTIAGLLFVGCYRDNDAGPDHPLTSRLDCIRHSGGIRTTCIHMENLEVASINSLLSDALHLTPRLTMPLAEAVLHKTGGNALFVVQFIASLHDEGLLHFSLLSRRWEWEISRIWEKDISDNVVELLTVKLSRMAPEVLDALKMAAALGARCQEEVLDVLDRAPERVGRTASALDIAVAEGIMNKLDSAFLFAHDQIQRAVYLLVPETDRASFHLQIGQLLWKWSSAKETECHLFIIVDQLHRGSSLICERNERVDLVRLSLMAGEMATAMSAFLPASSYLKAAVSLLKDEDWQLETRSLCFDLYNLCVETEYILGDLDEMKSHLDFVLSKGRTLQDRLRAYFTLVRGLGAQGRAGDAINTASAILAQLGESLPIAVTEALVKEEIATTEMFLSTETEDSLLKKQTMEDADKLQAMKFLHSILYYAFTERKSFLPFLVCRMIRLSVLHGVCKESAQAFACYGMISCGVLGDYSKGLRYGTIALSLLDRFQASEQLAMVYGAVYVLVKPFMEPVQACLPPLKRAIDVGLTTGDVQHAMTAAHSYAGLALTSGQALGPLVAEMKLHSKQMIEYKQHFQHTVTKPCWQTALNLIGESADPTKLIGEEMDEESLLSSLKDSHHVAFLTNSYRLWLEYLFGKHELAWESRKKIEKEMSRSGKGVFALFPAFCNNVFYSCLAAIALAREEEKLEYVRIIGETMAQMEDWATLNSWNCANKLELMKAEFAFLKGDFVLAATCYDLSVDLAAKHRFIHEQALALERYGIFYLERGDHTAASNLLTRARDCYVIWGAHSKVAHVKERYL